MNPLGTRFIALKIRLEKQKEKKNLESQKKKRLRK